MATRRSRSTRKTSARGSSRSGSGGSRNRKTSSRRPTSARKASSRRTTSARKKGTRKTSSSRAGTTRKKTSAGRRYSKGASKKVGRAMHEMKRGKLVSGRSKKKVKSREQAIAIGLSEARREGKRVPPPRRSRSR